MLLPPLPAVSAAGPVRAGRCSSGFTLVESLVVLLIMAIVTAMAVPVFRDFVASRAIRTQISDFSSAVRLARTEAIKRGRVVTLCRSADPMAAAPVCADGSDWSSGWLLRQGDTLIRVQPAYRDSGGIESGQLSTIAFLPTGIAQAATGRFVFRPALPTTDAAYDSLSRGICISTAGVTRPC